VVRGSEVLKQSVTRDTIRPQSHMTVAKLFHRETVFQERLKIVRVPLEAATPHRLRWT